MALPTTPCVPAQFNLNPQYSISEATYGATRITLQPKNPDGTPFDCTSVSSVELTSNNLLTAPFGVNGTTTPTLVSHTASGVSIDVLAADVAALNSTSINDVFNLTAVITDGTTRQIAGLGRMQISVTA